MPALETFGENIVVVFSYYFLFSLQLKDLRSLHIAVYFISWLIIQKTYIIECFYNIN